MDRQSIEVTNSGSKKNPRFYRALVSIMFIGAGCLHLLLPNLFMSAMPPFIPHAMAMIYLSGMFELAGGIGILLPKLRQISAWGLLALLVAVFPANIYMFTSEWQQSGLTGNWIFLLLRLPLQFVFMVWVWRAQQGRKPTPRFEN